MKRHRQYHVMLFCVSSALAGCAASDSPAEPSDIFARRCGGCHGEDGDGSSAGPQIRSLNHGYAEYVVRTGRGREMGFPGVMLAFSSDEVDDLQPILAWLDRSPPAQTGVALYVCYCGNCHGADALGGRVGEDIVKAARDGLDEVLEIVREGHDGTNYAARTKYMPAWSATELSDASVALITTYLASLAPGPNDDDDDDDGD